MVDVLVGTLYLFSGLIFVTTSIIFADTYRKNLDSISKLLLTICSLNFCIGYLWNGITILTGAEGVEEVSELLNLSAASIVIATGFVIGIEYKLRDSMATVENILGASSEASVNIANIATELAASASEVNASSEEIASTVQEISKDTQTVMASTDDIKNIMHLITSISDQTNLLALNASIEAGRAGEYGRGFAVVADEVRKLAEESKKAVTDTSQKITNILYKIQATTSSMEGISASTEEQTASMEEISATANKLGILADELKENLVEF